MKIIGEVGRPINHVRASKTYTPCMAMLLVRVKTIGSISSIV